MLLSPMNDFTSTLSNLSNPSTAGGSGGGASFGGVGIVDGVVGIVLVGPGVKPFVAASEGLKVDEAISSSREVAASSL